MMACRNLIWCILALSLFTAGCDSDQRLIAVDSEKKANEILVALNKSADITGARIESRGDKRRPEFEIRVSENDLAAARELLERFNLPRDKRPGLKTYVDNAGLVPSRTDEQARLSNAKAEEIANSLELIDRVVDVAVNLGIPEPDRQMPASAQPRPVSVIVKYLPTDMAAGSSNGHESIPVEAEAVREIVAKGMGRTSTEDIAVMLVKAADWPRLTGLPKTSVPPSRQNLLHNRPMLVMLVTLILLGIAVVVLLCVLFREARAAKQMPVEVASA